ncbi:MAG: hypothetical protein HYX22_02130 [Candidatus Yanofskybacteria bacterium]|nr:hypothetical protein [Candidatus Yanofskybacteria bacterium]
MIPPASINQTKLRLSSTARGARYHSVSDQSRIAWCGVFVFNERSGRGYMASAPYTLRV